MIPLVYHPLYNITAFGLERLHPFDGRKYRRIHDALIGWGLRQKNDFVRPGPVTKTELLHVHTSDYLESLRRSRVLADILEVPLVRRLPAWAVDWRILRPMRYATGGTMLACRLALEQGLAINLGGGYHHAAAAWGGGFSVYADTPLALNALHAAGRLRRALVVDLDAHQGNGTGTIFQKWPWASIVDLFEDDLYPIPKAEEDYPLPVPSGLTGVEYMDVVWDALPKVLAATQPDLVVYNAGSDPFVGDRLAHFRLTKDDLVDRDLQVVSAVREQGIPLAMVLSGGYSAESWRIHAEAIEAILARFDRA